MPCWVGRRIRDYLALVLAEYGDLCAHCGRAGSDSVEHVQPRSRFGTDALANLRPAHIACNARRGTKPMAGWMGDAGRFTNSPRALDLLASRISAKASTTAPADVYGAPPF